MERLLQDLGGVLRLAAIMREALVRCAAATRSGFGLFFGVSCGEGHGVLLYAVWVFDDGSLSKRTGHMPPRVRENGITSASRTPRTSCFLLATGCGIHAPARLCQFSHRLLHAASASGG